MRQWMLGGLHSFAVGCKLIARNRELFSQACETGNDRSAEP